MILLAKCFLVLLLEYVLFFLIGTAARRLAFLPSFEGKAPSVLCGFVIYHFVFWCAAYLCKRLQLPFHFVYYFWLAVLLVLPVLLSLVLWKNTAAAFRGLGTAAKKDLPWLLAAALPVLLILFYGTTHGQIDVDSYTYIGEIGTYLHTDALSGFVPGTGGIVHNIRTELRRGFALFGAESACWCRLFSLRAVAYCRYIRAALNYLLYAAALFSCVRIRRPSRDAFLFVTAAFSFLPLFTMNAYQQGSFLLTRGYEGKAWLAGFLPALIFYFGIHYVTEGNAGAFVLLFMANIACLNISASSIYVITPLLAAFILARLIAAKKASDLACALILFLPDFYFILQYLRG